jgi:hypothetical protein
MLVSVTTAYRAGFALQPFECARSTTSDQVGRGWCRPPVSALREPRNDLWRAPLVCELARCVPPSHVFWQVDSPAIGDLQEGALRQVE